MISSLSTPNLPVIYKQDQKVGEALTFIQKYINETTLPLGATQRTSGNQKAAPPVTVANPTVVPG